MSMDPMKYRPDFPFLEKTHKGMPLIYLDNACMTLKPTQVLDAICHYYKELPICAGRSVHRLGTELTLLVDEIRAKMARFLNAEVPEEVVFTRNTTEGINLVAYGLGLEKGDIVITADKEHNSNLVPWITMAGRCGIEHVVVPGNDDGTMDLDRMGEAIETHKGRLKLVSLTHTSNLDGVTVPAGEVIRMAHDAGAQVMLDAAQSVPHTTVDVRALDVDYLALSVHKMVGPTGIGILYGKSALLDRLDPFITGGSTVSTTSFNEATFLKPPAKFEAGLQNYGGIVGTSAAVDYLTAIGMEEIHEHEVRLNRQATELLRDIPGLKIIGPEDPAQRGGICNFMVKGVDPHDIALILDENRNVMIRSGWHCVHAWYNARGIDGSARASFYLYNTEEEVKVFAEQVGHIQEAFGRS